MRLFTLFCLRWRLAGDLRRIWTVALRSVMDGSEPAEGERSQGSIPAEAPTNHMFNCEKGLGASPPLVEKLSWHSLKHLC